MRFGRVGSTRGGRGVRVEWRLARTGDRTDLMRASFHVLRPGTGWTRVDHGSPVALLLDLDGAEEAFAARMNQVLAGVHRSKTNGLWAAQFRRLADELLDRLERADLASS